MVNKENIAAWVAALRSGKYKQGKEKLIQETPNGYAYCCLGVASELAGCKAITKQSVVSSELTLGFQGSEAADWSDIGLPKEAATWLGFDGIKVPQVFYENKLCYLSDLNDGSRGVELSFPEIADLIEKQWLNQ